MIPYVTTGASVLDALRLITRADRPTRSAAPGRVARTHSGHSTPTADAVWQSEQIVLPQRWHSVKLGTPGCR
ncbi:hypothetical protein K8P10_000022 [Leucobacter sp. Psy1]|nr:hypothetical protein K8P10_000022 [Leucobacter sp. Psy1]